MITPHRYRFTLGRNTPRTPDGKYIVYFNGNEMRIENREVEFSSTPELTLEEFNEKVKGTQGIEAIYGIFKDSFKIELNKFLAWVNDNYAAADEQEWTNGIDVFHTREVVEEYLGKQVRSLN